MRVTVTLDIDVGAWAEEYGVERSEVRDNAKQYLPTLITGHLESLGLLS
ncbi:Uncharacterised protein [Mycobacteroides abscessus subsp. bolletii]|nr:Uncharacterised protein [Mycobacteroides abscessus subsp. bolletii]SKT75296.1 Uncharacterised protein [Mycobacteroides abscessus subsp. bolletii]SLD35186.1 Uncharacterised protein [Mycobacteroides abscessus subsp. bolletii]SLF79626.1 Uncharacterised protein [Mycobacteroides abscessus subsp. bolletii]